MLRYLRDTIGLRVYVLTIPPTIHSDDCVLSTRPLFVVGCVGIYGKSHREIDKSDNRCGCKMISSNLSKNETVAFYCNEPIHIKQVANVNGD